MCETQDLRQDVNNLVKTMAYVSELSFNAKKGSWVPYQKLNCDGDNLLRTLRPSKIC
jgi:hypothetical protein